jgi:hypothetical protein
VASDRPKPFWVRNSTGLNRVGTHLNRGSAAKAARSGQIAAPGAKVSGIAGDLGAGTGRR